MQLDIHALLLAGGVPADVADASRGARKLEIDLHVADQNGQSGPSIKVDNLCVVLRNQDALNWNRDEGLVDVEYRE